MIKNAFARYASIFLVIVMAFSLFACDKGNENDGDNGVIQSEEKTTATQTVETSEEATNEKTETTTAPVADTTEAETTLSETEIATTEEETTVTIEATTVTEAETTVTVEATTVTEKETTVTEEETTVTEEETTVTEEETTVTEEETTVTEGETTVTEEETTVTEEETTATEPETTVTEEKTTVTEEETTEEETEAPKCKHRNAGVSYEKGCIVWCPDCESQVGPARHKNELKYIDGEGYYKVCKNCSTKTGDGEPYLVEWSAEDLNEYKLGKYQNAIVGVYNAEGNYTRFEGNGSLFEGQMNVVTADEFNTAVTGQYLLIKYRTNIADYNNPYDPKKIYTGSIELYYGTATSAAGKGEHSSITLVSDNEWHILVVDLSGSKYAPDGDGYYVAKHLRLDLINPSNAQEVKNDAGEVTYTYPALPEGYYVDLGFIAMCDDPDAFVDYFEENEADKELCNHGAKYVNDKCQEACAGCGKYYSERHTYDFVVENVDGAIKYVMPCVKCDNELEYSITFGEKEPNLFLDPKYIADAVAKSGERMGETEFFVEGETGFVRLHANTAAETEAKFMLIPTGSTQVTGQYMVIKYRTTCNYSWEIFMGNEGTVPGGGGHFYFENFPADGEWQLMLVDLSTIKDSNYTANGKGEYVIGHYRWDIFNTVSTEPRYIDIAYVAFADELKTLKDINGEFAKYCNHNKLEEGFTLITDEDEATDKPMRNGVCTECGATVTVELNRKFFIDAIDCSTEYKSRDASQVDLGLGGYTAKSDNTLAIKGWQGVDFGAEAIAYKVYDAEGNLLSGDWTTFEGVTFKAAEPNVTNSVVNAGVDGAHARRFGYLTIDLTEYFAQSENLTIVYAFVINNIPEGSNDKYCDFLTVTNITPAK